MLNYFNHEKVGIIGFTSMNNEWKDVVQQIKMGGKLSSKDEKVKATVSSWHQEAKDISLILKRELKVPVELGLSRSEKNNFNVRFDRDCKFLAENGELNCNVKVPDTVSPLFIAVDIKSSSIRCMMTIDGPKEKKQPRAKWNWLLRQIPSNRSDIFIKPIRPGRSANDEISLLEARSDETFLRGSEMSKLDVSKFEVSIRREMKGFNSPKKFIFELENTVRDFYEEVGQHLRAERPHAPKVKDEVIL